MGLDVRMPKMGESLAEGTLVKWHKRVGEAVRRDEPLFEISTDKVDTEVPAPRDGYLGEVMVAEGETVPVNTIVCRISSSPGVPATSPATMSAVKAQAGSPREALVTGSVDERAPPSVATRLREKSSPLVRRLAAEHGIDLAALQGSGTQGRVTKEDLLQHIQTAGPAAASAVHSLPERNNAPSSDSIEPLSVMRRNVAQRMVESCQTSAHVSTIFEVDMTEVGQQRKTLNQGSPSGERVSYLPFLLHAVAQELLDNRWLNASLEGESVRLHGAVHLGVAVALKDGLIVPVVRNADTKSIRTLAAEVRDLATRARTKKLLPDEVQGATFTVTNPGVFGSLIGTPIIPQPQVAILCLGAVTKRPVVLPDTDAIAVRSMSYLSLSFDHRLIDGAVADRFMAKVKNRLESAE